MPVSLAGSHGLDRVRRHRLSQAVSAVVPQVAAPFAGVFDYGCGRGNDIAILEASGIKVSGWDPHFRPDVELVRADVVNLGYVLNVIEGKEEREHTLRRAFELANQLLVVAVLTPHVAGNSEYQEYADGLINSRGTFQKYYRQEDAKALIEDILGEEALAIGSGMFFVFADKIEEQRFLENRRRKK